ncbi:hypothetical protein, partial [Proteus mirabilis]|uniref:hypothetical protein n=1 Tax=Proteus mirabilis TaxID=584 RepID=UPI001953300C
AYFALLPAERFAAALKSNPLLTLARIGLEGPGEAGHAAASGETGRLPLAFDHADILGLAIRRLRGKLD